MSLLSILLFQFKLLTSYFPGSVHINPFYINNGSYLLIHSVINDNNYVENGHDLENASSNGQNKNRRSTIDCGPKLANLRRYWRDYYVDPTRMGTSSTSSESASSTASEATAHPTRNEEEVDEGSKVIGCVHVKKPVEKTSGF